MRKMLINLFFSDTDRLGEFARPQVLLLQESDHLLPDGPDYVVVYTLVLRSVVHRGIANLRPLETIEIQRRCSSTMDQPV